MTSTDRCATHFRLWRIVSVLAIVLGFGLASVLDDSASARDNELRLAGPALGPETLDPAQMRDLSSVPFLRQIYRGLIYFDDELQPVPELAESYEISEDGLTYSFRLRPGSTFHDGSAVTADDVAFSLSRAVNPDTVEGDLTLLAGPSFLSDIEGYGEVVSGNSDILSGIEILAEDSLSIRLSAPRSTFLMKLAAVPAAIVDRDQVQSDGTWWARPNGSGPYAVDRWEPGDELRLTKYEDFVLGEPQIETISFRLGARSIQSFNLYQSGQIDLDAVSIFDLDRVTDPNSEFADQFVRTPQFAFGYIALRTDVAPLDDPKIREALQLAFPRENLAEITFNGQADPGYGVIPDGMLGKNWDRVVPETDFGAARQAIADSGYGGPDGVPPIRIFTTGALGADVLRYVAETELGLTVEVFDLEWYDFLDRLETTPVPAFELYWAADYPDPEGILLPLWGTSWPGNYTDYSNPKVDQLLADAAAESDPEIRAGLYARAQELIVSDNVVIPAYMDVQYTVIKPYVGNLVVTPIGILRLETVTIDQ